MKAIGYEDYISRLHSEFPEIDERSIKSILQFGTGKMLYYKRYNIDLFLRDDVNLKFYMYIGDITKDPYKRNGIYFRKKRRKLRHMYSIDKEKYDGYFYFGLTDDEHKCFQDNCVLDRVIYYKLHKEAQVKPTVRHIYRVAIEDSKKWFLIKENHEERYAEYLQTKCGNEFKYV